MTDETHEPRPAILGGSPVRESLPTWPIGDPEINDVLGSLFVHGEWGRYHGPHTDRLAGRLRDECATKHAILCASGTAAVEFALRGVGVGPGDDVVMAAYDFKANFQNALAVGAIPVLVDVHADNLRIDLDAVERAIGDSTRAVLVSHLHGGVVEMPRLMELAASRSVAVVEDACQMTGAVVAGRPAGSWGDAGVHSFGGSKLLTAGRGGAVVTNRDDVAQRIRLHKERGNDVSPLSEMQAAVLLPQWDRLAERNRQRMTFVSRLHASLARQNMLEPFGRTRQPDTTPAFYKLGFHYDPEQCDGLDRETFCRAMRAEGIPIDPGFRALHLVHARRRFRVDGELPIATAADERTIVLHHPYLLEPASAVSDLVRALDRIRGSAAMIRAAAVEA